MSRNPFAQAVSLIAALEVIVLASLAWVLNLRSGPVLGLESGAILLFLPLALIIVFAMWLVLRFLLLRRLRWPALLVLAASLVLGYLMVAASCGPVACFQPGPNRMMGWYLVLGVAGAALAHHFALTSFNKKNPNGH